MLSWWQKASLTSGQYHAWCKVLFVACVLSQVLASSGVSPVLPPWKHQGNCSPSTPLVLLTSLSVKLGHSLIKYEQLNCYFDSWNQNNYNETAGYSEVLQVLNILFAKGVSLYFHCIWNLYLLLFIPKGSEPRNCLRGESLLHPSLQVLTEKSGGVACNLRKNKNYSKTSYRRYIHISSSYIYFIFIRNAHISNLIYHPISL